MTDDARIARLTELARKVWPEYDVAAIDSPNGGAGVYSRTQSDRLVMMVLAHPRALNALEAALCVLAGEPPRWAVDMAAGWNRAAEFGADVGLDQAHVNSIRACADELLAAAKGKP